MRYLRLLVLCMLGMSLLFVAPISSAQNQAQAVVTVGTNEKTTLYTFSPDKQDGTLIAEGG